MGHFAHLLLVAIIPAHTALVIVRQFMHHQRFDGVVVDAIFSSTLFHRPGRYISFCGPKLVEGTRSDIDSRPPVFVFVDIVSGGVFVAFLELVLQEVELDTELASRCNILRHRTVQCSFDSI